MKILVVGLGYAGNRFLRAFQYIDSQAALPEPIEIAYVSRRRRECPLAYYDTVAEALETFRPAVVIVAVNDENHADILYQLKGFTGHVVCEKPLVNVSDDLETAAGALGSTSGFNFNLIERYSVISTTLLDFIAKEGLRLLRGNFHWGKDRINDRRPTCGATSEIIHALDLLQWLCPQEGTFQLQDVSGVSSDFSVSGNEVLDTAMITGRLGEAVVTGYSSFVNIVRQRTIDLTFLDRAGELIYARLTFDTPNWDEDDLVVWKRHAGGHESELLRVATTEDRTGTALHTIYKLVQLCQDVLNQAFGQGPLSVSSANLSVAVSLQRQLDEIDNRVNVTGPVKYVQTSNRIFTQDESSLEGLG